MSSPRVLDGDVIVLHAGERPLQRGQLVVVGGEQRLGPQLFGRRSTPAPPGRWTCRRRWRCPGRSRPGSAGCSSVAQRRSSDTSVISTMKVDCPADRSSLAPMRVKMRSTTPMWAGLRRDEGAHLRHEGDERHLAHVGGLTRHVGAGDDGHPVLFRAHVGVVGHKEGVGPHLLHHRVAARRDLDDAGLVHLRAAVVALRRHLREGAQGVQLGHRRRPPLHPRHLRRHIAAQGGQKSSYSSAASRSWAESISCSRSFSSWVMYRSPLTRVCLRM